MLVGKALNKEKLGVGSKLDTRHLRLKIITLRDVVATDQQARQWTTSIVFGPGSRPSAFLFSIS